MSQTTLSGAASGTYRCIDVAGKGEQVIRLKRMGICSGRRISVVQTGDPMILRVVGARVGLSRELAGTVIVESNGVNADRGSSVSRNGDNRD
ncbi:MAG TPA: ferrous iron transport protein A [Planctomycetes bacterium]|nr:ferrous iron transport protein A [Fuerstiella sp.]HIK94676.1 ferrous iron transport protein A [Planctomycetota bacterium]